MSNAPGHIMKEIKCLKDLDISLGFSQIEQKNYIYNTLRCCRRSINASIDGIFSFYLKLNLTDSVTLNRLICIKDLYAVFLRISIIFRYLS
jgi:hypothetical protein